MIFQSPSVWRGYAWLPVARLVRADVPSSKLTYLKPRALAMPSYASLSCLQRSNAAGPNSPQTQFRLIYRPPSFVLVAVLRVSMRTPENSRTQGKEEQTEGGGGARAEDREEH